MNKTNAAVHAKQICFKIYGYTQIYIQNKTNKKKSNRCPHTKPVRPFTQSHRALSQMFNCKLTQYCSKHYKNNRKESETITYILKMTSKTTFKHMNRSYGANRGWKIVPVKRCFKFKWKSFNFLEDSRDNKKHLCCLS